jgi:hypothetical protein
MVCMIGLGGAEIWPQPRRHGLTASPRHPASVVKKATVELVGFAGIPNNRA